MRFIVDVQPLAPGAPHIGDELRHQRPAEALPLVSGIDCRVEEEGVEPAVPHSVDEAHELRVVDAPTQLTLNRLSRSAHGSTGPAEPNAESCKADRTSSSTANRERSLTGPNGVMIGL